MAIKTAVPPKESLDTLLSNLQRLPRVSTESVPRITTHPGESLESKISYPHRVFALALDDIVKGNGLGSAKPVSWRYLVLQEGEEPASAEVNYDEQKGHRFAHLNRGAHNPGMLAAIKAAEADPRVAQGAYELRILRISALYVVALWLKEISGSRPSINFEKDLLIPIAPTNPVLTAGKSYSPAELLALLREPARQQSQFDDSPRGKS